MFQTSSFFQTQKLLENSLDAYMMRWQVISDNVANADTPNFKRSEVTFESELQRAINSQNQNHIQAKRTDPRHIPFHQPQDPFAVQPRISLEYNTEFRNDQNNVDMDKEMVDAAKTQLQYTSTVMAINRNYRLLSSLLR